MSQKVTFYVTCVQKHFFVVHILASHKEFFVVYMPKKNIFAQKHVHEHIISGCAPDFFVEFLTFKKKYNAIFIIGAFEPTCQNTMSEGSSPFLAKFLCTSCTYVLLYGHLHQHH
jgi:hypothetical protein